MTETRTSLPTAHPATTRAIIVSHGQPSDQDPAEAALANLAANVAKLMPGWTVTSATLAATGALDTAVEKVGPNALVYPLFMTDGWFTQITLPKRLNGRYAQILPPLGTEPTLPDLVHGWLMDELRQRGWTPQETSLILASHGSGKSREPARGTERFAAALAARCTFGELRIGYIEEPPFLGDMAFGLPGRSVCLPFFAAAGGHVSDDLPEALDMADFRGLRLPPIGTHPGVPAVIVASLLGQARKMTAK